MSEFTSGGFDYVDFIVSEDDMKTFQRMKELESELKKPAAECLEAIMEYTNLERKLRRVQPAKFIVQKSNPKLN